MDDVAYSRNTVLYVGGLDEKVDETILHGAFIPFGDIMAVEMPKEPASGKHRGFAFVAYDEPEDAKHAMENMSESELFGRVLKVNIAKPNAIKNRAGYDPSHVISRLGAAKNHVFIHPYRKQFRVGSQDLCSSVSTVDYILWAEADKWYDKTLKADSKEVDSDIRAQQRQDSKAVGPAMPPGLQ